MSFERGRWAEGEFLKLWGGQTVSELGSTITLLALPTAAVLVLHADALQVGLLAAMTRIPFPFLSLFAGVVVHRLPRRPILIVCDAGRCLVVGSIPLTAALNLLSLPQLFVTSVREWSPETRLRFLLLRSQCFGSVNPRTGPAP